MGCVRTVAIAGLMIVSAMLTQAYAGGAVATIDGAQMQAMIADGARLIDIRRADEWQATGIVPGAALITAFDAEGRLDPRFLEEVRTATIKGQPVILICRSGNRSMKAGALLLGDGGYSSVASVSGGMNAWIAAGAPVLPCPNC